MVRQRFSIPFFFWNNNNHRIANGLSDEYCIYNLYGFCFCIKEHFWSRNPQQDPCSFAFCYTEGFNLRK